MIRLTSHPRTHHFPVALFMLLALVLGACSPIVPVTDAPVTESGGTVPNPTEPPSAVGIYKAFMPGASSPGLDMTLFLNADGSLRLVSDYQNEEPPFVEEGNWSAEGDQVTITLAGAESRVFTLADGQLTSADWIGPWHNFTDLAMGSTPPYEASALTDAAAAGNFAGFYKSFSPSASCCGLDQTLLLAFDNTARMTSDYLNGEAPIVETGTWQADENGRVTVTLTGRDDGTVYDVADVLVLEVQDGLLVSVEADASRYGAGLRFFFFPGLAIPNMN